MNKELEEAVKILKEISFDDLLNCWEGGEKEYNAIQTVLNYINNSIPKETIEKYLENEKELFETYKKESKTNENLKLGLYKHIGAKNMCERILGIEKTITTLEEGGN